MSTVSAQASVYHMQSGLSVAANILRESNEDGFSSDAIPVTTVEEQVDYGEIISPRHILLKLISGDDVQVGFQTGVYHQRLSGAGDLLIARLDVEGLREISTIGLTSEAANGTLHEQVFMLEGNSGAWEVWFDIDGTGVNPSGVSPNELEITTVDAADTIDSVGSKMYAEMTANTAFMADFSVAYNATTDVITITDKYTGTRTNIADGGGGAGTGFTFNTTQQGAASPDMFLKSVGTSQIVVAVIPN